MAREGFKDCPFCAEEIREKAIICRYCNRDIRTAPKAEEPIPLTTKEKTSQDLSSFSPVAEIIQKEGQLSGALEKLTKLYPQKVMEGLFKGIEKVQVGERRNITVLFADICGFTSLSETLDPEQIKEIIDACYGVMVEAVQAYGGLIDKFLGDAVMALFGAPAYSHEDDPERAIKAALQIQERIKQIGIRCGLRLEVSIGVNCGEVVVGAFGSGQQMDYTAIGDTVNLASRLQGLAGRGQIFVGERVYRLARGSAEFEFLGAKEVKGKREKVNCYKFINFKEKILPAGLKERSKITPLIGRQKELQKLILAYQNAIDGSPQVVLIRGEAGVGKSRLLYELSCNIKQDYIKWLNGTFVSYGQNTPYLPIINIIKKAADIADNDDKNTIKEKLKKFIDLLILDSSEDTQNAIEFLLAIHSASNPLFNIDAKDRKEKIFRSIEKVFLKLSEDKPLVLIFEDLHWGDPLSLEFFKYFLPRLKGKNNLILVAFNFRPIFKMEVPEELDITSIDLFELSNQESQTLLYQILGIAKLPQELEEKLLKHSEGNPFYLEEIVLALKEEGTISLEEETNLYKLNQPIESIKIPDTIQGVILARLDQLQEKMRNILQCASVIGMGFRYKVLHYLIEIEQKLKEYLSELVEQNYILETTAIPELIYLFKHTVTREVIYGTLLRKTRKFFHGRIGLCLEEIYKNHIDEHYELLAHHFYNSEHTDKAIYYLEKAAAKTELLFANEAAIEFNSNLIETIEAIQKAKEDITVEEKKSLITAYANRGRVRKLIGNYKEATIDLEKSISLCKEYNFDELEAKILKILADIFRLNGRHNEALKILERARQILHSYGNIFEVILTINNMGAIYRTQGRLNDAIEKYKEALMLSEDCSELETKATAANNLGITYLDIGRYDEAMEFFLKALDIKRNMLDKKSMVAILNNIGIINERKGEYDKALNTYSESLKIAHEIGYHRAELACHLNLGQTYQILGNIDKSIFHFKIVIEKSKGSEDYSVQSIAYGNLAWSLIYSGRNDSVASILNMALELADKGNNFTGKINALLANSMFMHNQNKYDEGLQLAQSAIAEVERNNDLDDAPIAYRMNAINFFGSKKYKEALKSIEAAIETSERTKNIRETIWASYIKGKILKEDGITSEGDKLINDSIEKAKYIKDKSFFMANFLEC